MWKELVDSGNFFFWVEFQCKEKKNKREYRIICNCYSFMGEVVHNLASAQFHSYAIVSIVQGKGSFQCKSVKNSFRNFTMEFRFWRTLACPSRRGFKNNVTVIVMKHSKLIAIIFLEDLLATIYE